MDNAESRRKEEKEILTWEMAGNSCAIKVSEERKLYRSACDGSWVNQAIQD